MSLLAPTLQAFFVDRLAKQRQASPRTVIACRDTFRLLLCFLQERTGKQPVQLDFEDLDAPSILAFLGHLEADRGNSARTRKARIAALRSMFHFAALRHPEHAELIANPQKRHDKPIVAFLTEAEIKALLAAPDRGTWIGRRDHALLALAIQTGLRAALSKLGLGAERSQELQDITGSFPSAQERLCDARAERRGLLRVTVREAAATTATRCASWRSSSASCSSRSPYPCRWPLAAGGCDRVRRPPRPLDPAQGSTLPVPARGV
jgi:hypothetical protein